MHEVQLDNGNITLIRGDCLEVMPKMKAGIIDLILADLPYGTTRNKWDSVIPLDILWQSYKSIGKANVGIALTASQPFTSILTMSNLEWFRHEWIWIKNRGSNFANTVREPFKEHESVLFFSPGKWVYNKQMQERSESGKSRAKYNVKFETDTENYNQFEGKLINAIGEMRVPSSWQKFNIDTGLHPTQKPVALMEYLIRTYTNEGDLVLDNTMGSGTTAVACINTNRRFVGIEKDTDDKGNSLGYFDICIKRCEEALEIRKHNDLLRN